MVNVHTRNEKLVERGLGILEKAAGIDRKKAARVLKDSDNQMAVALIMCRTGLDRRKAVQKLRRYKGNVRKAMEES
jgi:N-acetylmuramic acid 6-phosphate etherase